MSTLVRILMKRDFILFARYGHVKRDGGSDRNGESGCSELVRIDEQKTGGYAGGSLCLNTDCGESNAISVSGEARYAASTSRQGDNCAMQPSGVHLPESCAGVVPAKRC